MNANELTKYYSEELELCKMQMETLERERTDYGEAYEEVKNEFDFTVDKLESLIRELSRYKIRVAAEEKPTEEDATFDGYEWYVMAQDVLYNCWGETPFKYVAKNEKEYPHWTCVPKLPEVTPNETKEEQH